MINLNWVVSALGMALNSIIYVYEKLDFWRIGDGLLMSLLIIK